MVQLIEKVSKAARGDHSMEWLKPYMTIRRYRLVEIDLDVAPGQLIGELGLVAPGNLRTQTLICSEAGEVLTLTYDQVRQLYFQNPQFGFYFLRLVSERLFRDLDRVDRQPGHPRSPASVF